MAKPSINSKTLAKLLSYVLGYRPDEFGLVADSQGYISIKELLKALHQEDGWRHLRMAHFNEMAATIDPCPVEISMDRIRAQNRDRLPRMMIPRDLPKLLYIPIRSRAYPTVLEKGLISGSRPHLVLSSLRKMALKLGRRMDNEPVILIVQVAKSLDQGVDYRQYGESLYLADEIPVNTFSGPPLPKDKPKPVTTKTPKAQAAGSKPNPGELFSCFSH